MSGLTLMTTLASILFTPGLGRSFEVGMGGLKSEEILVLLADGIMFPSFYLANGIVKGLAVRCCTPNTFYSMENFSLVDTIGQSVVARFVAPPLARTVIDSHG